MIFIIITLAVIICIILYFLKKYKTFLALIAILFSIIVVFKITSKSSEKASFSF